MNQTESKPDRLIEFFASTMTVKFWRRVGGWCWPRPMRWLGVILGGLVIWAGVWSISVLSEIPDLNWWRPLFHLFLDLAYGLLLLVPFKRLGRKPWALWLFLGLSGWFSVQFGKNAFGLENDDMPAGAFLLGGALLVVAVGNALLAWKARRDAVADFGAAETVEPK